jgi:hypothetical protein
MVALSTSLRQNSKSEVKAIDSEEAIAKGIKTGGRNFEPGKPGGPGRPPMPDDIKALKQATNDDLTRLVHLYWGRSKAELAAIMKDPKSKVSDLLVCSCFMRAIVSGDYSRVEGLLDRLIGKLTTKTQVEHSGLQTIKVEVDQRRQMLRDMGKDPEALKALEAISERLPNGEKAKAPVGGN